MVEELELAVVAELLLDDWVPEELLDAELVLLVVAVFGLLATALAIGFAAMTPTSPVNARPVSAAAAGRARAAG